MDGQDLLDRLPKGRIIAKDLSVTRSLVPGNPYCRYDTEDQTRKYCSKDLWDDADEKYIIPEDSKIPRPHEFCESCEQDSYTVESAEREEPVCGRCGKPIFVCPAPECEETVYGEPDKCPECGASYKWS